MHSWIYTLEEYVACRCIFPPDSFSADWSDNLGRFQCQWRSSSAGRYLLWLLLNGNCAATFFVMSCDAIDLVMNLNIGALHDNVVYKRFVCARWWFTSISAGTPNRWKPFAIYSGRLSCCFRINFGIFHWSYNLMLCVALMRPWQDECRPRGTWCWRVHRW